MTTAAELFVPCLENESVEKIFGIPGEENRYLIDALLISRIKFITIRHEQTNVAFGYSENIKLSEKLAQ